MKRIKKRISTIISRVGLNPSKNFGIPNPPVYHASTILYPNSKSQRNRNATNQLEEIVNKHVEQRLKDLLEKGLITKEQFEKANNQN